MNLKMNLKMNRKMNPNEQTTKVVGQLSQLEKDIYNDHI